MGFKNYIEESNMSRREAEIILDLKDGYTAKEEAIAYKLLAKHHHPDHGGDVEAMKNQ